MNMFCKLTFSCQFPSAEAPQVSGAPVPSLCPLWKAHLLLFSPRVGQVVNIKAKVNRAFNTSMEVCGAGTAWGCTGAGWFSTSSLFSAPSPGMLTLAKPWSRQQSSEPAGRARRILRIFLFNTHNTEGKTEARGEEGICPRSPSHIDPHVGLNV